MVGSRKVFFTYERCQHCGLLYCPHYPSDGKLQELYSSVGENLSAVPLSAREKTQAGYAAEILKRSLPDGDYLEIGPDIGLLAKCIGPAITSGKMIFIEPNHSVHTALAKNAHGEFEIKNDLDAVSSLTNHSLALAVGVHVLDHLRDPRLTVEQLVAKLRPGGVLSVVVHDEQSLLARVCGKALPIYCVYHPQLFSQRSLGALLRSCGLSDVTISKTTNHYPLDYLCQQSLAMLGIRFGTGWSRDGTIGVKLGNIQATAVRR